MNATLKKQIEKTLALVFCQFKNEKEAYDFLSEFLTPKEMEILSRRLSILYWLSKKRNYANISNNLKVSSATIAEGKEMMKKRNIKEALKRIDADIWAEKWSKRIKSLV